MTAVAAGRGGAVASGGDDETVVLWDAATGAPRHTLKEAHGAVRALAFSPNGKLPAASGDDGQVRLYDARSGTLRETRLGHAEGVRALAFRPHGSRGGRRVLASASGNGTVILWRAPEE